MSLGGMGGILECNSRPKIVCHSVPVCHPRSLFGVHAGITFHIIHLDHLPQYNHADQYHPSRPHNHIKYCFSRLLLSPEKADGDDTGDEDADNARKKLKFTIKGTRMMQKNCTQTTECLVLHPLLL